MSKQGEQETNNAVVPRPAGYRDFSKVMNTWGLALKNDPMRRYLRDTPASEPFNLNIVLTGDETDLFLSQDSKSSTWFDRGQIVEDAALMTHFISRGWLLTVDEGDGLVGYWPANDAWSFVDKALWCGCAGVCTARCVIAWTKQQLKRGMEVNKKYETALEEALGDRKNDMLCLGAIATTPSKQGRGYGSVLARAVCDMADARQRPTWVMSSNISNTTFYNRLGFEEKARIVVGDDDPTWQEPPVVALVMIREPRHD